MVIYIYLTIVELPVIRLLHIGKILCLVYIWGGDRGGEKREYLV